MAFVAEHPGSVGLSIGSNGLDWGPLPSLLHGSLPSYVPETETNSDVGGGSPLNVLTPEDARSAIAAFGRCLKNGVADSAIETGDDGVPRTLTLWDLRDELGTVVAVLVPGVVRTELGEDTRVPRPRLLVHTVNESGQTLTVDDGTEVLLGWTPGELVGAARIDFVHPEDQDDAILAWIETIGVPGAMSRRRSRYRHKDGKRWVWFEITTTNLLERFGHVRCEMLDITESMAAFDALTQREQLLRFLTDSMPHGIIHLSAQGEILFANRRIGAIAGRDGGDPKKLLAHIAPDDRRKLFRAFDQALDGRDGDVEGPIARPDGTTRWCHIRVRSLGSRDAGVLLTIEDITERWEHQRELTERARTDSLTGLLNRQATVDELQRIQADARWSGSETTVAFLDLDGFKQVNDRHGHQTGDRVLAVLAASIRSALRPEDVIGRLGGDEFLVIWRDTDVETAVPLVERLRDAIARPVSADGAQIACTTSCGIATDRGGSMDVEELIAAADRDMYREKRSSARVPQLAESTNPT